MTLKEIYQAAIDGEKIRMRSWHPGSYLYLKDTHFVAEDESTQSTPPSFLEHYLWEIYEEPEDLDNKIRAVERKIVDHLDSVQSGSVCNASLCLAVSELIDLKIKQAKL